MKAVRELHFPDNKFSLYFLATLPEGQEVPMDLSSNEAREFVHNLHNPVLELTHNHGTEDDANFKHFNGNEAKRQGFGHIGFVVEDVYSICDSLAKNGCN